MIIPPNKVGFGVLMADWQDRINMERMRKERAAKLRAELKEHGFPAILLADGECRRYATSMDSGTRGATHPNVGLSIFYTEYPDDTVVWESAADAQMQTLRNVSWIKPENVRIWHSLVATMMPGLVETYNRLNAEDVYQELRSKHLEKEKIAYDTLGEGLKAQLVAKGLNLVPARQVVMEARNIKTIDEINCMKLAGTIAMHSLWALYENLRPGITESELSAKVAEVLIRYENRSVRVPTIRSGPNTAPNNSGRSPTDRIIEPGDLVFVDIAGPLFNGYRSCQYRTFKCGLKPTQQEKDMYQRCFDSLVAAEEAVKPGVSTAEIAKCLAPSSHYGFEEEYTHFMTNLGHGIGLSQYEPPFIQRSHSFKYPETIQKGQVFALETYEGVEWKGGVRVENVGLVTDEGFEKFYSWPDEEIVVPAHSLLIR